MKITLSEAAQLLSRGQVIGIPTETVYGLAALTCWEPAIQKIYRLKGRPANNPLIVHAADLEQVKPFISGAITKTAEELAAAFWPGPLTLILPASSKVSSTITAGLQTVAIRLPAHLQARELIKITGPLVAPSANLSGSPSATSPDHVEADFGLDFPVLDGGLCQSGLESTILAYYEGTWRIARLGALPPEAFQDVLGYFPLPHEHSRSQPICPGALYRHYAPEAKLFLSSETPYCSDMEVVLGFEGRNYQNAKTIILGNLQSPEKIARNLYAALRLLDEQSIESAWVDVDFEPAGLLATIKERLYRSAAAL